MAFERRSPLATTLASLAILLGPPTLRAQEPPPDPVLVQSSRTDLLLDVPSLRDAAGTRARMSALIGGCRRSMRVQPGDSAAAIAADADPFTEDGADGPTIVVLTVLASEGVQIDCGDRALQGRLAASRGLRITGDSSYIDNRDVVRAVVRRGDDELRPVAASRQITRRLTVNGFADARAGFVRLAFDVAALAPATDGVLDDLTLEVHYASGGEPDRFAVPWSALRTVWERVVPARAAMRPTRQAPMPLPAPSDEQLHAAHAAYTAGDLPRAVAIAMARIPSRNVGRDERRGARVMVGLSLAALGDTAAARVVLSSVLDLDPCFTLASTAPAGARAIVDALRRESARCTAQSSLVTAARGLVLPGFARPTVGRERLQGALVAGAVVGMVFVGTQANSDARGLYDEYLAYQGRNPSQIPLPPNAPVLYDRAESRRLQAKLFMTIAAVAWTTQLVEGVVSERRHARRLDRVQQYGREAGDRRMSLAPILAPGLAGVAVNLNW